MSSRIIAYRLNNLLRKRNELDSNNKVMTVHYTTINKYLREYYGKPLKIRKVFFLSNEQMTKRKKFCEMVLNKKYKPQQIFFSDETKIELGPYTNDYIRLDPTKKEWDDEKYNLINRPKKKFEKSIMVAGGINYFGLSQLIFLEGTMNDFSYGQALLFYKDDIEKLKNKSNEEIIFEQDGAPAHTSKSNKFILNKLFSEGGWLHQILLI